MGKRKLQPAIHVEVTVRSRGGGDGVTVARVDVDIVTRPGQRRFIKRLRETADQMEQLLDLPKPKTKTRVHHVGRRRPPPRRRSTGTFVN